jgi:hypothetical protein
VITIKSDGALSTQEAGGRAASHETTQVSEGASCKVYLGRSDPMTIKVLALRNAVASAEEKHLLM